MPQARDVANSYWVTKGPWPVAIIRRVRQTVRNPSASQVRRVPYRARVAADTVASREPPACGSATSGSASRSSSRSSPSAVTSTFFCGARDVERWPALIAQT